jgi:flagellar hook-length control protein FliK
VEVQLSSTAAGITARLIADSPEAARMLAHAGEDLRRSLEDRNVTLISLEVATSGEERREAAPGGRRGEHADERAASGRDTDGDAAPGDAEAASDPVHSVLELPGGLLVDVLA